MDLHWYQQMQHSKLLLLWLKKRVLLMEIGGVAAELNFGLFVVVWGLQLTMGGPWTFGETEKKEGENCEGVCGGELDGDEMSGCCNGEEEKQRES